MLTIRNSMATKLGVMYEDNGTHENKCVKQSSVRQHSASLSGSRLFPLPSIEFNKEPATTFKYATIPS